MQGLKGQLGVSKRAGVWTRLLSTQPYSLRSPSTPRVILVIFYTTKPIYVLQEIIAWQKRQENMYNSYLHILLLLETLGD